jgi:5-methylcytosine-specific restriction endonuclease McrBC regulatory subunit McrC
VLTVAVAPKVWRKSREPRHWIVDWPAAQAAIAITAYEGDCVTVSADQETLGFVGDALDCAAIYDQEPESMVGPLLQRVARPSVAPEPVSQATTLTQLVALIALFDHSRLELPDEDAPGAASLHPLFRALLHRRFVSTLEPLVRRVRRGYVELEDVLTSPRGRIADTSVVRYQLSREPRLLCRFDEYTEATPLLRVVVAALAEVLRTNVPPYVLPILRETLASAVRLARHLATVPIPDRSAAIRLSRQIRLTRLEAEWRPALEFAQRVLVDAPLAQDVAGAPTEMLRFEVATDRVWERILEQGLRRALPLGSLTVGAGNTLTAEATVEPPWKGLSGGAGSRFPDFLVTTTYNDVWCIDAKYKMAGGRPNDDDANQMFVYSHLANRAGAPVAHCALLYPARPAELPHPLTFMRCPNGDVDLRVAHLSFPEEADLTNPTQWGNYVARLEHELDSLIGHTAPLAPAALLSH